MDRIVGVFLKYPQPGKVKTRLASDLGGDREAATIYRRITEEVFRQIKRSGCSEIAVFFDPPERESKIRQWIDPWIRDFPERLSFHAQTGGQLGERLCNASKTLLPSEKKDPRCAVIVGTDCIGLDRAVFAKAWSTLEEEGANNFVLGPATDGGYYLIGLTGHHSELFEEIPWSTNQVQSRTVQRARELGLTPVLLPERSDIDTASDYRSQSTRLGDLPCVFFDRDGVVNRSPGKGYVLEPEKFHLQNGIRETLATVLNAGWLAIVATSQKGVGKELMSKADLRQIHRKMQRELAADGLAFDGIYAYTGLPGCPYQPKPDPAMIFAAARDFSIDLSRSWIIGDADRDIKMGKNAKLAGSIRVMGENPVSTAASHTVDSVLELPDLVKNLLKF